jgi:hypothetical protein
VATEAAWLNGKEIEKIMKRTKTLIGKSKTNS